MSTPYQRIEEDLQNDVLNTRTLKRPFKSEDNSKIKETKWRREFRRAKYHNRKIDLKTLYYYLGETLEQEEFSREITKHEKLTAKRIFYIHEPMGPDYLTGKAGIADYKGLTQEKSETLREVALEVLSEREPLVGENLLDENLVFDNFIPQYDDQSHECTSHDQSNTEFMGNMMNMMDMGLMGNMKDVENMPNMGNIENMGDMEDMLDMTVMENSELV